MKSNRTIIAKAAADTSALGNDAEHEIIDSVMDFDIQSSTPMEALMFLDRLQNEIRKKGKQGT